MRLYIHTITYCKRPAITVISHMLLCYVTVTTLRWLIWSASQKSWCPGEFLGGGVGCDSPKSLHWMTGLKVTERPCLLPEKRQKHASVSPQAPPSSQASLHSLSDKTWSEHFQVWQLSLWSQRVSHALSSMFSINRAMLPREQLGNQYLEAL